jgi:hypothetical protein
VQLDVINVIREIREGVTLRDPVEKDALGERLSSLLQMSRQRWVGIFLGERIRDMWLWLIIWVDMMQRF